MTTDGRTTRVREVRRRVAREGPPWTRDRERDFEALAVPGRHCDLLRDLLISERVETVVEVGLAYTHSALAIGEALVTVDPPRPRHIIIDPFQEAFCAGRLALLHLTGDDPDQTTRWDAPGTADPAQHRWHPLVPPGP